MEGGVYIVGKGADLPDSGGGTGTTVVLKLPVRAHPRAVCVRARDFVPLSGFPSGSSACSSCHKALLAGILTHEIF